MTPQPPNKTAKVYLGLGGNQGDVTANFLAVAASLKQSPVISWLRASSIYHSKPWGAGEHDLSAQADYLNQVVEIETELSPTALLQSTQTLELLAGRDSNAERWAARPLDIDILLYSDKEISLPQLTIPHPRMCERAFVLVPLLELDAALNGPGRKSFTVALKRLYLQYPDARPEKAAKANAQYAQGVSSQT